MTTKTPWYPKNSRPVRSGLYLVHSDFLNNDYLRYYDYDAQCWKYGTGNFEIVDKGLIDNLKNRSVATDQDVKWRGQTSEV